MADAMDTGDDNGSSTKAKRVAERAKLISKAIVSFMKSVKEKVVKKNMCIVRGSVLKKLKCSDCETKNTIYDTLLSKLEEEQYDVKISYTCENGHMGDHGACKIQWYITNMEGSVPKRTEKAYLVPIGSYVEPPPTELVVSLSEFPV
jgi:hypothetical protein